MEKLVTFFSLVALFVVGSVLAAPEKVEHGNHGADKHKPLHFKAGVHNDAYDYEALLGSRDHEELNELDDDVRKNRLTNLAKSHDTNKNGFIELEELQDWILHSFRMLDHQEAVDRRTEEDDNGDGMVGFEEILKKQYGFDENEVESIMKNGHLPGEDDTEMREIMEEDLRRFDAADLNHDKLLNTEEYVAFVQPYDHPHMHDVETERTMRELDEDKDGFISEKEFIRIDPAEEETYLSEKVNFDNLDKDKDGKLTLREVKPWAVFDNSETAKEEADHLFKEADDDKDGQLSLEEIIAKEEEFVSSQATDYGRHLHFIKDEL